MEPQQSRRLRIAVLGTRGFPHVQGGVETHCEQLYPRLAARGCEVVVFARRPYVGAASRRHGLVQIVPLRCPRHPYLEAWWHTFAGLLAARRIKPDVLHIHALGPSGLIPLARLLGYRVVMTHHGPDYQRQKWGRVAKWVLRMSEASGTRCAHAVICIAEYIASDVRERFRPHVAVIPNGVPPVVRATETSHLQPYGLAPGRYLLSVGRFVPEKGFHHLIEAFAALERRAAWLRAEGWKLVIAGGADHEASYGTQLRALARRHPHVVLPGIVTGEPLRQLFSHAGLFVLPSSYEGLPIALLEAMSYGASCLASAIPAHASLGLDADRFFQPGDVEGLARVMERFAHYPWSAHDRARQQQRVAARYDWERIADQTFAVYQTVLQPADRHIQVRRPVVSHSLRPLAHASRAH